MKNLGTTPKTVNGLTELNPADPAADFLLVWDTSAGGSRKVKPNNLGLAGGASPTYGTATIDFGAFPGSSHATLDITGQTGILTGSRVKAWLMPADTADHSADEHLVEPIKVMAGPPTAGVGFTIHAFNDNPLNEPLEIAGVSKFRATAASVYGTSAPSVGGMGTLVYGQWNVCWEWI